MLSLPLSPRRAAPAQTAYQHEWQTEHADWTDRDVFIYLQEHDLPYHPLWEQGYVSIGDVHTTRSLEDVDDASETRFFGLKRECGLHG
ncbi:MAG: phosphoadenosine phosphosulfate reductase family protein [Pseudomonadales bacterium]